MSHVQQFHHFGYRIQHTYTHIETKIRRNTLFYNYDSLLDISALFFYIFPW